MVNTSEYEQLEQSTELCVMRSQYIEALSKINEFLNTEFLSDQQFMKNFRSVHLGGYDGVVSGVLVGLVFLWPLFVVIGMPLYNTDSPVVLLIPAVIAIIVGIIGGKAIAKGRVNSKGREQLVEYRLQRDEANEKRSQIKELKEKYTNELKELVTTMSDRNNCIIPQKYWDYAPMLISYIDDCRAHDLESAINVLETDLHNKAMEQMQMEALMEQTQARILSEIAAENSEIAREAAELAAINSAETLSELRWQEFLNSFDS